MATVEDEDKSSFATTDQRQFLEGAEGECVTCKKEEAVCEHSQCRFCECKEYCWLD